MEFIVNIVSNDVPSFFDRSSRMRMKFDFKVEK